MEPGAVTPSVEQRLRDALEAMGSRRAQSLSAGELMALVVEADRDPASAAPRQSANVARALAMVDAGTHTALEAARAAGVSPSTVYRVIAQRREGK